LLSELCQYYALPLPDELASIESYLDSKVCLTRSYLDGSVSMCKYCIVTYFPLVASEERMC